MQIAWFEEIGLLWLHLMAKPTEVEYTVSLIISTENDNHKAKQKIADSIDGTETPNISAKIIFNDL